MFENPLADVRDQVAKLPNLSSHTTNWADSIKAFRARIARAVQIVMEEPEILLFAVLQWLVIGIGYVTWFQILNFIPSDPGPVVSQPGAGVGIGYAIGALLIASAWSMAVLVLVALPVGILSAAMGTAHLLRRSGRASTISSCLTIAARQMWPLWTYHAIDGYVTINAVLARLPKRNGNRSKLEAIAQELLYFAWKLGCIGVLPAMICGHGIIESGQRSFGFVKAKLGELALLRAGYGGLCWGIGSVAYILGIIVMFDYPTAIISWTGTENTLLFVIATTGLPLIAALAVILVVLQPIYILSVCDLYADHLEETGEALELVDVAPGSAGPALASLAAYAVVAILAAIFAQQFGVAEWMTAVDRGAA